MESSFASRYANVRKGKFQFRLRQDIGVIKAVAQRAAAREVVSGISRDLAEAVVAVVRTGARAMHIRRRTL
jgi:hypothetical protein